MGESVPKSTCLSPLITVHDIWIGHVWTSTAGRMNHEPCLQILFTSWNIMEGKYTWCCPL